MILVFIVYFKEKRDDQMKKKIVEDFNRKSQHKKWTKRKMLNLAISSGLLFTSLAIPVSIAVTSGTISASAAVLDIELLSNVTSNNDSGTSTSNRWTAANQNQPVNFTVSGGALADASAVFSGQKQAVLVVPPELRGNVAAAGSAAINTNVTIDLSKVTFLTAVLNAANDLTNVITQITSGALGNLTGVDIDLTEVNRQLELVNNIENLGAASFTAPETLAADGSYISAPISDGLGLVLAQNVSNILQDLNAAVQALEAKGTSIPSNLVAAAINAALLPVKGTVNVAVSGALPLLAVGGSGVNELVDASLLGTTTVTLPTTVSTPQNLSNNLDARFVGTVVQTDLLDVNLLATADGVSNIYFAAGTTSEVTAPTITGVTGNSVAGYQVTGTADPNATIEIRDVDGNVIATGTADGTGSFAVNLPAGTANANETLTALAKDPAGNPSTPTTFQTPADEVVAPPSVDKITGNTTQGYQVTGTAELGTTIEVRATDGTVLGTATTGPTGQYTVTLASGKATAKQTVNVVAKNDTGLESQPTTAMTPADVTTPTIGDITGDSTTGYEITGTADPNTTIEVRNPDGTIIGTTTTDDQGNFTVDLPAGAANPGDTLTVVGKDGDGNESQPTEVTVPEDATVAAPTVTTVTGTTATGYQVTGTAEPNVTIEIHNEAGLVIATGTTDGAGAFTITLPTGTATANEALTAIAKDAAGKESNPTAFKTPADPDAPVATPTVDKITGSTTKGYQVVGAAEVGTTVEVRDADGTVLGMATTGTDGKYTVTLEPGKASANETITVVAKNATGKESQPATATTPADLATPTIDSITGNSSKGYEITGTAEPKTTIDVRDADGTIIAATTANETGQYTVTLPAGIVTPGETITIISKDSAGNESQPATAVIPADVVLAAPTITKVEGNKANGYTVTGTADPNVTVQFYNSSEKLLASGNTTTGGTFSVHIAAGLATEKETLTALTTDTQGNVSPKTTFMTPADITGEPEIKIAAPTVSSVLGTSKAGYLIKGTAEPNRIIQISNRLLRSVIAVGATDAEGNFAIQLTAGQATAQQSLLATATDGAGHYSTATTFMTPADPTNPGGGNGNTGGNNGNTGGNTGNNGATGGNNGNGSNTGSNPNGGSGLGTTGSGLGSLGNGLGTNGSAYNPKLSTISYGTGNHGKTGYLPSTGEKESSAVTTSLFGAFVAFLASMGIVKRKRKN
ncbi:cell wall anchor protein [Enterococcus faecalis]|nr:cell wall anchor protein [Enterococcus faecalis]